MDIIRHKCRGCGTECATSLALKQHIARCKKVPKSWYDARRMVVDSGEDYS